MKKVRSHLIVLGLWILTIVILETISINPKDATSEIPPKPPPHEYLIPIISNKQLKLDPVFTNEIAKSIHKYSNEFNIPAELIISIITVESAFIPTSTSSANCVGLLQINPKAHPEKIEGLENYQLYHIDNNIKIGCRILKEYYEATGSINDTLTKYLGKEDSKYNNRILSSFADLMISKK
jgi:hypothetical protein